YYSRHIQIQPRLIDTSGWLQFSLRSRQALNVRYWHLADIPVCTAYVRFVPIADIQGLPGTQRKLQPARRINQAGLDLNVA
ncbi:MAG: hypothetical protein WBE93_05685, partial [Pseudolabrys sp.]